jgi:hypothetical protein
MSNYQIITDENALREFIDFLPNLNEQEKYYCCLFARSKYCKELTHIKSDKAQLKRFVSDKERLFDKIAQLEIPIGRYKQKQNSVPQEALALYITINPRNMYKATINTMVKLAQSIRDQNVLMNPHQEALSEIQRTKSRTCYIDFDIDNKMPLKELRETIQCYINQEAINIIETRGGYHVLINPVLVRDEFKNTFYQNLSKLSDQSGDQMIPVPGTYQGGFTPKILSL